LEDERWYGLGCRVGEGPDLFRARLGPIGGGGEKRGAPYFMGVGLPEGKLSRANKEGENEIYLRRIGGGP